METLAEKVVYMYLKSLFIIMFLPKTIQMLMIGFLFFVLVCNYKKIYIDKRMLPFLLFSLIHLISIIFNMFSIKETSRIVAALNTCSLWILGTLIFSYIEKINLDKRKVNKIMFYNVVLLIFFALVYFILTRLNFGFNYPIIRKLATLNWAYGVKGYRFVSFMEYPNLVVIFYFISLPFALDYIKEKNRLFKFIFLTLSILPVFFSDSRLGIVLCIINYLYVLPKLLEKEKFNKFILITIFFLLGIIILLFKWNDMYHYLYNLIYSRQDSTSMRTLIYQTSINKVIDNSILIGCGIKTMMSGYPLGSHSTIIGTFYKTGVLGTIFMIWGFCSLLSSIIKRERHGSKIYLLSFLCLLGMLVMEDLDGANWSCILFFMLISIFISRYSVEVKDEQ